MPRLPTGVYEQPFPDVVSDTTIESAVYNGFVNDIESDLNLPRPIVAGGTGASNDTTARQNLKTERSMQQVTNYDSHVWEPGSFWSYGDATSPPIFGHSFHGTVYGTDQNNLVIQARSYSDTIQPGRVMVREKKAGVWTSGWNLEGTSSFVELAGDTMTGNLTTSGKFISSSKEHAFGGPSGGGYFTAVAPADANIKLYDLGSGNWCGMGTDTGGNYWVRTGLSGASIPPLAVLADKTVAVQSTTAASSATTGALVVTGGIGVSGFIYTSSGFGVNAVKDGLPGWGNTVEGGVLQTIAPDGPIIIVSRNSANCGLWNVNTAGMMHQFSLSGAVKGSISISTGGVAFNTTSDERLKEDLKSFDAGNIIDDTVVYDFKWKDTDVRAYGVIAQQAKEVYDTPISYDEAQDNWFVDYSKYVPVLLQEMKALRARVAELEGKIAAKPA